jgi:glucose/arabinose dehydrogenase
VRRALAFALLAVTAASACGGDSTSARRHAATTSPTTRAASTAPTTTTTTAPLDPCASAPIAVGGAPGETVFVDDANFTTSVVWAPDGRLFFGERAGAIRIAAGGTVSLFATVPTVTGERSGGYSERGLLGLALSPQFATDHGVYVFFSNTDYTTQSVVRFTDCAGAARDPVEILRFPSGPDCCHKGGRLAFGPDGKLYVTLGEEHSVNASTVGSAGSIPQDPGDVRGKILRYNPDGTIPDDNPFGAGNPVFATGFRNPYGIAFGDGRVFVTANGPTGDIGTPAGGYDLAFEISAGGRYQWPACYGYSHLVPGASSCLGRPDPDWSSESQTLVPTGATWVDGRGPAPYAGHFVFCTFVGGMRVFVPGAAPGSRASVTGGPSGCRLDVRQGPDGALYYSDTGAIYRLA